MIEFLRIPEISKAKNHGYVIENLRRMHDLPCVHICRKPLYPLNSVLEWLDQQVGWFIIGYGANDEGTFNVSGGTTNVSGHLTVGFMGAGYLNMTNGSVSRTFEVGNASVYDIGDMVIIEHPATEAWLEAINHGDVAGDEAVWVAGQSDLKMRFSGYVTAIEGNKVRIDTPIYHALDRSLSQATVYAHTGNGIITECGVENLRIAIETAGGTDESHRWDCVHFIGVENCWAKDSTSLNFADSGFRFTSSTRSTILDCSALDPISIIRNC